MSILGAMELKTGKWMGNTVLILGEKDGRYKILLTSNEVPIWVPKKAVWKEGDPEQSEELLDIPKQQMEAIARQVKKSIDMAKDAGIDAWYPSWIMSWRVCNTCLRVDPPCGFYPLYSISGDNMTPFKCNDCDLLDRGYVIEVGKEKGEYSCIVFLGEEEIFFGRSYDTHEAAREDGERIAKEHRAGNR